MPKVFLPAGMIRPVLFAKPTGLLDASAVTQFFGRKASNASATIAALKRHPAFPEALKPFGATGQEFWHIAELDEFVVKHCPRVSSFLNARRKWAANDPRRLRAQQRAAARSGEPVQPVQSMESVQ